MHFGQSSPYFPRVIASVQLNRIDPSAPLALCKATIFILVGCYICKTEYLHLHNNNLFAFESIPFPGESSKRH